MSTKIEAGSSWNNFYWNQEVHSAVMKYINTDGKDGALLNAENPGPILNGEGGIIELPSGKTSAHLYVFNHVGIYYDPREQAKVHYQNAHGESISIYSHYSFTEVKLSARGRSDSEILIEGEVMVEEMQSPPTIVYRLIGSESVLKINQKNVGELKITNQRGDL